MGFGISRPELAELLKSREWPYNYVMGVRWAIMQECGKEINESSSTNFKKELSVAVEKRTRT